MGVVGGVLVGLATPVTGCHNRCPGVPVIAAISGEHLVLLGEQPGSPNRVLNGVSATVGEEHFLEIFSGELHNARGGFDAGLGGIGRSDGGKRLRLLLNSLHHSGV